MPVAVVFTCNPSVQGTGFLEFSGRSRSGLTIELQANEKPCIKVVAGIPEDDTQACPSGLHTHICAHTHICIYTQTLKKRFMMKNHLTLLTMKEYYTNCRIHGL